MTLFEVDQAANRIREEVDEEANIIFGSAIDEALNGKIRVSVVATGIDTPLQEGPSAAAGGGGGGAAPEARRACQPVRGRQRRRPLRRRSRRARRSPA